jgi:DNA invertase Pin-like site-specific DNA recombinase
VALVLHDDTAFGRRAKRLSTTVAFLAETPGSATIEEQQAHLAPDDIQIFASRSSFNQFREILARNGMALKSGDQVKIHSLSCLSLSTTGLIRVLTNLLHDGISIQIVEPAMVIIPREAEQKDALLDALDAHYRHLHGIKTHPPDMKGRKRILGLDQLPAIRALLDQPGVTATEVAQQLGVARATLFNYLVRHEAQRSRGSNKADKRGSKNVGNDGHVSHGDPE